MLSTDAFGRISEGVGDRLGVVLDARDALVGRPTRPPAFLLVVEVCVETKIDFLTQIRDNRQ